MIVRFWGGGVSLPRGVGENGGGLVALVPPPGHIFGGRPPSPLTANRRRGVGPTPAPRPPVNRFSGKAGSSFSSPPGTGRATGASAPPPRPDLFLRGRSSIHVPHRSRQGGGFSSARLLSGQKFPGEDRFVTHRSSPDGRALMSWGGGNVRPSPGYGRKQNYLAAEVGEGTMMMMTMFLRADMFERKVGC